jgi:chromosome segregation ATPase
MDYNKMQNDNFESALINIETLQKEYEVILQQYQEAVKNYISTLETSGTETTTTGTNSNNKFVALKGKTWWGANKLNEGNVDTQEECEAMCAESKDCSGATFNPVKRYCWARKGDGTITVGEPDDYALVPKQRQALTIIKQLNEKLLSINEQISSTINNINPEIQKQMTELNKKRQELNDSYDSLLGQKANIETQLNEYYSIQEENDNQIIYVTQQEAKMKFWTIITVVILLITMKNMYGDESPPMILNVLLIGILVFIVLTTILRVFS